MKLRNLCVLGIPLMLGMGCVYSHRQPAVYTATPVVVPTSERPAVRVYESGSTRPVVVEPNTPTTAAPTDVAIADNLRHMYGSDASLSSRASNVRATVQDGRVTLEGTVPSRSDKKEIEHRIAAIPGVREVNDRLDVGVPGR